MTVAAEAIEPIRADSLAEQALELEPQGIFPVPKRLGLVEVGLAPLRISSTDQSLA